MTLDEPVGQPTAARAGTRDRAAAARTRSSSRRGARAGRRAPGAVPARHPPPEPYWREALRRDPGHVDSLAGSLRRGLPQRRSRRAADELLDRAAARLTRRTRQPARHARRSTCSASCARLGDDAAPTTLTRAPPGRGPGGPPPATGWPASTRVGGAPRRRPGAGSTTCCRTEPEHLQALALGPWSAAGGCGDSTSTPSRQQAADAGSGARPARRLAAHLDGQPASGDAQTLPRRGDRARRGGGARRRPRVPRPRPTTREGQRPRGQTAVRPLLAYHRAHVLRLAGRGRRGRDRARAGPHHGRDLVLPRPARRRGGAPRAPPTPTRATPASRSLLGHWTYAAGRRDEAPRAVAGRSARSTRATPWPGATSAWPPSTTRGDLSRRRAATTGVRRSPRATRGCCTSATSSPPCGTSPPTAARLRPAPGPPPACDRDDLDRRDLHLMISDGRGRGGPPDPGRRRLHPWEGGEGQALLAWDRAHSLPALARWPAAEPRHAVGHLRAALAPPPSLGEARHPLASTAHLAPAARRRAVRPAAGTADGGPPPTPGAPPRRSAATSSR